MSQISTASMGKFDKKINKDEPDAPKSTKKRSKFAKTASKSTAIIGKVNEKDRNMNILKMMERETDSKAGGRANAKMNTDKMANIAIT